MLELCSNDVAGSFDYSEGVDDVESFRSVTMLKHVAISNDLLGFMVS